MFLTKEDRNVIKAVYDFWTSHAKAPPAWRKELVEQFTREWKSKVNLSKPIMRHPKIRKKDSRMYSVLDILTDYLLDVSQVDERSQEYPIHNTEKIYRNEKAKLTKEVSIVFDEEHKGINYRTPPYSIEEYVFNNKNPVLREPAAGTIEELTALLLHVKQNEDKYVKKLADSSKDWNEQITNKKRTPANVRKAIRKLDIKRVRLCKECGTAFYAHDRRQTVCDLQKYKNSKLSNCQIKNKRKNEEKSRKIGDLRQNNSII